MIKLEKGKVYEVDGYYYLIGGNAAIGNVYCISVTPKGNIQKCSLGWTPNCIYGYQDDIFKVSKKKLLFPREHKQLLINLFDFSYGSKSTLKTDVTHLLSNRKKGNRVDIIGVKKHVI